MQAVNFFDDEHYTGLLPLSFTRPLADLRIGILTITEKWSRRLNTDNSGFICRSPLSLKFTPNADPGAIAINGRWLPDEKAVTAILNLKANEVLTDAANGTLLACPTHYLTKPKGTEILTEFSGAVLIGNSWDLFRLNGPEIEKDFKLVTQGKKSICAEASVQCWGEDEIFIEEGAKLRGCTLNAEDGPIYIGQNAEIMEGSNIRGPFALCAHSTVKMGAKIYGSTTIGPYSKVGGELNNVVIQAYSNKGHDGFLGNSVIGEWCNLGADTNNSNLKNNYAPVKLWSYKNERFLPTGLQFCGLIMGDHSKCGINTMFNTGTVVGVAANIFGAGFPRNFIPSFAWGGAGGFSTFQLSKVYETAEMMMSRRGIELSEADRAILAHIFETGKTNRYWEQQNKQS